MKILAINTSHDTSIVTMEDGVVTNVWEEERHRREKYWSPKPESTRLLTLDQRGVEPPEYLIFASFDRRNLLVDFSPEVRNDRLLQRDIANAFQKQQCTRSRIREIMDEFNIEGVESRIFFPDGEEESEENFDTELNKKIAYQVGAEEHFFDKTKHHLYHAESGYYFSPWYKDDEPAIAITWDGGGAQPHFTTHPNYQEIESIYRIENKHTEPKLQWQKLSNHRWTGESKARGFYNMLENCLDCPVDETVTLDGVETVLTSQPSNGMNFSNLSYALGCDKMGRAAGKVMGMASYAQQPLMPNVHTRHTTAQRCELESLEAACDVIRHALDLNPDIKNVVLSGGFSLNCTNNYKYMLEFPEVEFFVDPIAHDGGTAVGAGLWLHRELSRSEDE